MKNLLTKIGLKTKKISRYLFLVLFVLSLSVSTFTLGAQEQSTTQNNFEMYLASLNPSWENNILHLSQSLQMLEIQSTTQTTSNEETNEVSSWLDSQMSGLLALENHWIELTEQVQQALNYSDFLSQNNKELIQLLEDSGKTIEELKKRLHSAEEGVMDAIENWWYMEGLLDEARSIADNWERETLRLQRQTKLGNLRFVFGVSAGATGAFGVNDMINGNYSRGGVLLGSSALIIIVDQLGHRVFRWW